MLELEVLTFKICYLLASLGVDKEIVVSGVSIAVAKRHGRYFFFIKLSKSLTDSQIC